MNLIEILRETASTIEVYHDCKGMEKRIMNLLRDAAERIEDLERDAANSREPS